MDTENSRNITQSVLTVIVKFVEKKRDLHLVCKDWKDILETNDRDIMVALDAYKGKCAYERIREVMRDNNFSLMKSLFYEYTDYLPVRWEHMDLP